MGYCNFNFGAKHPMVEGRDQALTEYIVITATILMAVAAIYLLPIETSD